MTQPAEYVSTPAAGRWLRKRGFAIDDRTIRRWCQPGGVLAHVGLVRTPGGKVRVPTAALVTLLRDSGIDVAA